MHALVIGEKMISSDRIHLPIETRTLWYEDESAGTQRVRCNSSNRITVSFMNYKTMQKNIFFFQNLKYDVFYSAMIMFVVISTLVGCNIVAIFCLITVK